MRLRLATPLALLALAVPVAGCGEDEKDQYIDDFKPLNDKLLDVGRDLGVAVQGADDQSDAALAKQFAGLATRLEGVKKEIAALDTPADLKDEAAALDKNLDATVEDLEDISEAAGNEQRPGRGGRDRPAGHRCPAGEHGAEQAGEGHRGRRRRELAELLLHRPHLVVQGLLRACPGARPA